MSRTATTPSCQLLGLISGDQVVTRSFTFSTNRSTASTPCFAAVAPCCSTVLATRLMRVTGDCLRAVRFAGRFVAALRFAAERVAGLAVVDLRFVPRVGFAVALLAVVRFDALVVLRRAFLRDDFDAVAMINFLEEGTGQYCARFEHSIRPRVQRDANAGRDPGRN